MIDSLELVIFDMDGLMFDTERIYCESVLKLMADLNVEIDPEVLYRSIGTSFFDYDSFVLSEVPDSFDIKTLLRERMEKNVAYLNEHGIPKKPGLDALLDFLESRGIKKAVATSTPKVRALGYLDRMYLTKRFATIVTKDDITKTKPDPEVFLTVTKRLNISIDSTLILEDSLNGALAALNAGIKCILVPDMVKLTTEVRSSAYKVVDSLFDVVEILK